jgi:transcriptional regulator with XRE-family HTH domain
MLLRETFGCVRLRGMPLGAFAARVRRYRKALTLTQPELAARARIHRSHLAKIELGQLSPTVETIEKLAKALHVTPGQLFEDEPGVGRRPTKRRTP